MHNERELLGAVASTLASEGTFGSRAQLAMGSRTGSAIHRWRAVFGLLTTETVLVP